MREEYPDGLKKLDDNTMELANFEGIEDKEEIELFGDFDEDDGMKDQGTRDEEEEEDEEDEDEGATMRMKRK